MAAAAATVRHLQATLRPDPSRTVIRPFLPGDPAGFEGDVPRGRRIAERVIGYDPAHTHEKLCAAIADLACRHRDPEALLKRRYEEVRDVVLGGREVSHDCALLIGAYFCEEYSFEAAALFNPSVVLHLDQSGLAPGCIRFVMSLRGIGEGHVSSVTFRTGVWDPKGDVTVDPLSSHAVPPRIVPRDHADPEAVWLECPDSRDVSETVLFPITLSQKQGIEDMRLVTFVEEDGSTLHLGTYTAFSGSEARSELLQATDFNQFLLRPMRGVVANSKGTALFPRRIDGRYRMLGRQDNENIWLLASDSLTEWTEGAKLVTPRFPWEFVQMGNCGSPIEIDEGWLVLTHGVGMVRNYCIGACLLDKADPSKVLARTPEPILEPTPEDRDGYVPNVVYSCGGLVQGRTLLLPYGVADGFTTFASVKVDDLLGLMD